jgi:hypothetical protein
MSEPDKYRPPEFSALDHAHTAAKGVLGMIPVAGSLVAEVFGAILPAPRERRQQKWMNAVATGLRDLEEQGAIILAHLQDNEQFVSTLLQASQAAQRSHQEEKIEALRNAVLNSALPNPPEESLQQIFVGLVDSFTVWHLRILRLFEDPPRWFEEHRRPFSVQNAGGLPSVLEAAFPELQGNRELYDLVWKDLNDRSLVNTTSFHSMISASGTRDGRTTGIGKQFLQFVTEPPVLTRKTAEAAGSSVPGESR